MSDRAKAILEAALRLPDDQLWELIDQLQESECSPDHYVGMTDEKFQAEMICRAEEAKSGVPGIPWAEVEAEAVRDLNAGSH